MASRGGLGGHPARARSRRRAPSRDARRARGIVRGAAGRASRRALALDDEPLRALPRAAHTSGHLRLGLAPDGAAARGSLRSRERRPSVWRAKPERITASASCGVRFRTPQRASRGAVGRVRRLLRARGARRPAARRPSTWSSTSSSAPRNCRCYAHLAPRKRLDRAARRRARAVHWLGSAVRAAGEPVALGLIHPADPEHARFLGAVPGSVVRRSCVLAGMLLDETAAARRRSASPWSSLGAARAARSGLDESCAPFGTLRLPIHASPGVAFASAAGRAAGELGV